MRSRLKNSELLHDCHVVVLCAVIGYIGDSDQKIATGAKYKLWSRAVIDKSFSCASAKDMGMEQTKSAEAVKSHSRVRFIAC